MAAGARVRVMTNNDIAYLWWSVPKKIPKCLGFTIHRQVKGKAAEPLPAWVGFDANEKTKRPKTTDVWPVQSFQWKDVFAPRTGDFRYLIYAVKGTPKYPVPDAQPLATTPYVALEEQIGNVRVVFNRGLLATQALNRGPNAPAANANQLRKAIGTPGNKTRLRLTKELLGTITELHERAKAKGGTCYSALYELTDEELIQLLLDSNGAQVLLSNANSSKKVNKKSVTVYDGTNADSRKRLKNDPSVLVQDRLLKGASIGHNKFTIYETPGRVLKSVLTGSTNWTPTGLCGQTNNAVLIDSEKVAKHYHAYFTRLQSEQTDLQTPTLRTWTRGNPLSTPLGPGQGTLKVWFSPNTTRKTKSDKETPVDMKEVFGLIDGAKKAVLFLVFNPGKPSIVDHVKQVAAARSKAGKDLFVRGAISDPKTAAEGSVRVFGRGTKRADTIITGVAGVPDAFGAWEKELLKLGHAVIHDKVLVIDPFSANCVVVTGSHNLGHKASFSNDENLLIFKGNRQIAEAYAAHVLDVVNHYKWRYKLQELHKQHKLKKAWSDLEETDTWQDKYFNTGFLASRDRFVLE